MEKIFGTSFLVDGTWYLRYAGGGGSMVPIKADSSILDNLQDGKMVELSGNVAKDAGGCILEMYIQDAKTIG